MEPQVHPKKHNWNWILWWRVDDAELEEQIAGYRTLSIWRAARKVSVLCLCLSMVITTAFVAFGAIGREGYFDVALFAILAAFIYFGHRWAMIGAMLLWTFEKVVVASEGVGSTPSNGGTLVTQLVWWAVYMHAFYLAFRTEQRRRALTKTVVASNGG